MSTGGWREEALHDRLTTFNECVRVYIGDRDGMRAGWLEEEVAATDALLSKLAEKVR